jgi:hypothetical protein
MESNTDNPLTNTIDMTAYQIPELDSKTHRYEYLTIWIGAGLALIIAVIMIFIAANQKPDSHFKIEIKDIASVFTAIIVTTTCVYHAMNLKLNLKTNRIKLKFDTDKWQYDIRQKAIDVHNATMLKDQEEVKARRLLTMDKCLEWHRMSEKTGKSRAFIETHIELLNNNKIAEFVALIEDKANAEYRSAIICVMNYFENLAEGIESGLLDEDYVKNIFKTMFLKYLTKLEPYYAFIEKRNGENGIFRSFKKVAERWK